VRHIQGETKVKKKMSGAQYWTWGHCTYSQQAVFSGKVIPLEAGRLDAYDWSCWVPIEATPGLVLPGLRIKIIRHCVRSEVAHL